jgi:hypothetical protein
VHQLDDTYRLAKEPQAVVERLITDFDEFSHLMRARIVCVLSERTPMLRGSPCAAFIGPPTVQGAYRPLFDWLVAEFTKPLLEGDDPEYFIIIDAALWPTLDSERQERLMYHELCHLQPREGEDGSGIRLDREGRPLLKVVPHDTEVFHAEIRKYGPHIVGLEDHCLAIVEGNEAARQRRLTAEAAAAEAGRPDDDRRGARSTR